MTHPLPSLSLTRLRETLITVLDHAMPACAQVEYRLVGTGAALLHGVSLPAANIDTLVKDRSGVDAFCAALVGYTCLEGPIWLPDTWQYYANYDFNNIEVGFSTVEIDSEADTIETFGRGPWEHFVPLPCGAYRVPTVALELRLITELYRQRLDRSEPLLKFMQKHGCDLDFIKRGMAGAGMSQAVQTEVLRNLQVKLK